MRKIIVFNLISLDGFYARENGDIDWHNTDEEFAQFANEQTPTFGILIFGRVTYDIMASYWPTKDAIKDDPIVANALNTTPKIVFSKSLKKITETPVWKNISLFNKIIPEEIIKLKKQTGKDMVILGSGTIVQQFTNLGLIDEYRLLLNPVVLGSGKPMFNDVKKTFKLKLISTRKFKNGNVLLCYVPKH
ncbi:dihydrofolate reductase [Candidatus Gottesmanbacteria bacterium]|nr:dihydrofolate reductase [Candidatus Gottesmanbacteria bacterium]